MKDNVLVEDFGFGAIQLGSKPPLTCPTWVILTLGKTINFSKGNNTYLLRSLEENEILYIQYLVYIKYLSLSKCLKIVVITVIGESVIVIIIHSIHLSYNRAYSRCSVNVY